jgi:hypothetical protein
VIATRPFTILGKDHTFAVARPTRVAFVDMTGADLFHDGDDIDLSHWDPNRTHAAYRADTSTEITLNFAAAHPEHDFFVCMDHADTDGFLSVFSLVCPEIAVRHRDTLAGMAEMGDFSFFGARRVATSYQWLRGTVIAARETLEGVDLYHHVLSALARHLDDPIDEPEADRANAAAVDALFRSADLVTNGMVERTLVDEHFVALRMEPGPAADATRRNLWREPRFDTPLDEEVWLSQRARNRVDAERMQLLSIPVGDRWHHSLWYPQYVPWDTETLWRAPGFGFTGDLLTWRYPTERLAAVLGDGWWLAPEVAPWTPGFPLLAATGDPGGSDRLSDLSPDAVTAALRRALVTS